MPLTLPAERKVTSRTRSGGQAQSLDSLGAGFELASHTSIPWPGNLLGEEQSATREVGYSFIGDAAEAVAQLEAGIEAPAPTSVAADRGRHASDSGDT